MLDKLEDFEKIEEQMTKYIKLLKEGSVLEKNYYVNKMSKLNDLMIDLHSNLKNSNNLNLKAREKIDYLESEVKLLNNQLYAANTVSKALRTKYKEIKTDYHTMTKEEWKKLIDENRKLNNKPNFSKIGKILDINHETVKKWIHKKV